MQKLTFEKFYTYTRNFDFAEAVSKGNSNKDKTVVSLYLSCEQNSFIEYGDFRIDSFGEEFHELLVGDGYLEADGTMADKVGRILCWQVWINFVNDDRPSSGVHLFDYTDAGINEINEYVEFSAVEE